MVSAVVTAISKLAPMPLLGLAVASAIVIFVPDSIAVQLGIDQFRVTYRGELGWFFLVTTSLTVCTGAHAWYSSRKRKADSQTQLLLERERRAEEKKEREEEKQKRKEEELYRKEQQRKEQEKEEEEKLKTHQVKLQNLTGEEKAFVAPYIFKDTTAQYAALENGVVQSLLQKSVLMPPHGVGNILSWPFHLQEWAKEYLKEHPEVLEGYEDAEPRRRSRY